MAIDNPFDAYEKRYPKEEFDPTSTSLQVGKFIPGASSLIEICEMVRRTLDGPSMTERVHAMWEILRSELERCANQNRATKVDLEDFKAAIRIAVSQDVFERNDKKRERYVRILGNAVVSETRIEELASFIQDVERLNEKDLLGLKVLNRTMNKAGDWKPPNPGQPSALHPNTFIQRAQELAVQMAIALGKKTDGNTFSREEGYQICLRLQGFGLAEQIDTESRQVPITNYAARLTPRGLMLLRLIGEDVPNWEHYFDDNGAL